MVPFHHGIQCLSLDRRIHALDARPSCLDPDTFKRAMSKRIDLTVVLERSSVKHLH